MGALKVFAEFVKLLVGLPNLVKLNSDTRQQIRDAAGTVADELIRGLQLVSQRIHGAEAIVHTTQPGAIRDAELRDYLNQSESKLSEAFSEFKICRSLRATRGQFNEMFSLPKIAIDIGTRETIQQLLTELEHDERMIFDEVGPILRDLRNQIGVSDATFFKTTAKHLNDLSDREIRVRELAREVHDKL